MLRSFFPQVQRTSESSGSKEVASDLKFPGAFDVRHSRRARRAHSALPAAAAPCIDLENDEKARTETEREGDGTFGARFNTLYRARLSPRLMESPRIANSSPFRRFH